MQHPQTLWRRAPTWTSALLAVLTMLTALTTGNAHADDLNALSLQVEEEPDPAAKAKADAAKSTPAKPGKPAKPASIGRKWFADVALGQARDRTGGGTTHLGRLTLDGREQARFGQAWQGTLSARLDHTEPEDQRLGASVLSLREAYLGWQDAEARQVFEAGRINLREGPAYAWNPTDWFKTNALRTITTANPASLRESRLGTAMLRGQRLWDGGSLALVWAPKLADGPSRQGLSVDLGATNAAHRGLLSLGTRWSESLNTQLSLYAEQDREPQFGASLTALLSDALVWHAEAASGRSLSLSEQVLTPDASPRMRHRLATGLTWTTASKLSLTAEWHRNGAAPDRQGWQALRGRAPQALPAFYALASARQDNASNDAFFLYAVQRDLGVRNLDLTALLRHNASDSSRLTWVELRWRLENIDLALQWQRLAGEPGSEFGSLPLRDSIGAILTLYF